MTYDASKSAQSCGCDLGVPYICAECAVKTRAKIAAKWATDVVDSAPLSPDGRYENHPAHDPLSVAMKEAYETPIGGSFAGADLPYVHTHHLGIGGAPTRATTLPTDAAGRKQHPVASGVLDYFPDAIVAVSNVSWAGNEQHNPGQPLHWARGKSTDESDTMIRHFLQRGTLDTDGMRHSAKMVWRALAILQKEIEGESR